MKKFTDWLDRRDETFKVIPSDVGDETPPQETRGLFHITVIWKSPRLEAIKSHFLKRKDVIARKDYLFGIKI